METDLHLKQMMLLISCLNWLWRDRNNFFVAGNLTIYYSQKRIKTRDFRGPDFFVVQGVESRPRKSWTIWEEDGKYPNLIIELLSTSTAEIDRTLKKTLYQDRFRTPEYFWFSPDTLEFEGFRLTGNQYEPIASTANGWRWSEELELFLGIENKQLRYFTRDGDLVPTPDEAAIQERQRADQLSERADQLAERADQLAEYLRSLGIDPNTIN